MELILAIFFGGADIYIGDADGPHILPPLQLSRCNEGVGAHRLCWLALNFAVVLYICTHLPICPAPIVYHPTGTCMHIPVRTHSSCTAYLHAHTPARAYYGAMRPFAWHTDRSITTAFMMPVSPY
eukprot:3050983-Rhodomonas_salina.4